jgi:hypothetical protein
MFGLNLSMPHLAVLGSAWTPAALFAGGSPGFWAGGFNPAAGRLFQTHDGALAASGSDQSVGLVLDNSQNAALGPELANLDSLPVPGISHGGSGSSATWNGGTRTLTLTVSGNNQSYPRFGFNFGLTVDKRYQVNGYLSGELSGVGARMATTGTLNDIPMTGGGVLGARQIAAIDRLEIRINGQLSVPTMLKIETLSIREIAGNHPYQATALSRPTLTLASGRWHLHDDGNDALNVTLPAGTYSRAWVDNLGAITVERGIAISGAENILRATRLSDVLYVQGSLSAGNEASLRAHWNARYPA